MLDIHEPFLFLDPRDGEFSVFDGEALSDLVACASDDPHIRYLGDLAVGLNKLLGFDSYSAERHSLDWGPTEHEQHENSTPTLRIVP